jgi:hypothetical protein
MFLIALLLVPIIFILLMVMGVSSAPVAVVVGVGLAAGVWMVRRGRRRESAPTS